LRVQGEVDVHNMSVAPVDAGHIQCLQGVNAVLEFRIPQNSLQAGRQGEKDMAVQIMDECLCWPACGGRLLAPLCRRAVLERDGLGIHVLAFDGGVHLKYRTPLFQQLFSLAQLYGLMRTFGADVETDIDRYVESVHKLVEDVCG
jgi:hypothetical protein